METSSHSGILRCSGTHAPQNENSILARGNILIMFPVVDLIHVNMFVHVAENSNVQNIHLSIISCDVYDVCVLINSPRLNVQALASLWLYINHLD